MKFGRKHSDDEPDNVPEAFPVGATRVVALVTETDKPLDNLHKMQVRNMVGAAATTRILLDVGGGPVTAIRDLWLDQDHWLTAGMEVPVMVNPANPNDFAVDWAAVPSMAERAAANEPSLTDPLGAKIRVWDALTAHGYTTGHMADVDPSVAEVTARGMKAELDAAPEQFAQHLTSVAQQPAPAGMTRALVLITTTTATLERGHLDGDANLPHRNSHGRHRVVLSVSVPNQAPYAVFVADFDHKDRAADPTSPGLPALVSMSDRNVVDVLWDELQTLREQRHDDRKQGRAANAGAAGKIESIQQQIGAVMSNPTAMPTFAVPSGVNMLPEVKVAMTQSAKMALGSVTDPAMRQTLIDHYQALGLDIDEIV